ncbi:MAG: ABC transporter permease [Pseudomonadota bacterium]
MDLFGINPVLLVTALMVASTPILLAAIGELVVEKSGVLNLGVEGMMITGAICGFIIAVQTGSPTLGFVCAALGGAALSLIFAVITLYFLSNQVATGLALTLFGLGLSSLLAEGYREDRSPSIGKLDFGPLSDIPGIGQMFFSHDAVVYLSLLLVMAVWAFLSFTRGGLILRACGENPEAAHALGYNVKLVRMAAIAFGGACAGVGGAYISMVRISVWTDDITAGAGWIALAMVVFGAWRPGLVLLGAYLFGGVSAGQFRLQAIEVPIPVQYLSMSPYIVTILVLVMISAGRSRAMGAPAALGQTFHASR